MKREKPKPYSNEKRIYLLFKMQFRSGYLYLILFFLLPGVSPLQAQIQFRQDSIQSILRKVFKDRYAPGGVFLVAQHGQLLYHEALGQANMELMVPMKTDQVFQIGSMTKQFTAVAILLLEEQHKLKVTDRVVQHLPDFPNKEITIHHLLTHTSGLKDFTRMKVIKEIAQKEMTPTDLVALFKNEPLDFEPGTKMEYNNSGYVLLGHLIETISKDTYANFIQQNIFQKAGMTQSRYATDRSLIPQRALGYHLKDEGYVNKTVIHYSVPYASGALMSTTMDLWKWQQALNAGKIIANTSLQKAFTAYTLVDGSNIQYGYGWHIRSIQGMETREHGGSIFGYKSMAVYIPQLDLYVVGLSNCDCHSPTAVVQEIAAYLVRQANEK